MRGHKVVLNIQDTTELDFNGCHSAGLGPLSYEAQRGIYLHPTYAVSPARGPLGVLDAWMQLGRVERIETALALYLVVAWRINRLMRLGRSLPELPADLLFEQDEWQAA